MLFTKPPSLDMLPIPPRPLSSPELETSPTLSHLFKPPADTPLPERRVFGACTVAPAQDPFTEETRDHWTETQRDHISNTRLDAEDVGQLEDFVSFSLK
jgi:hypothetical protein